MMAPLCDTGMQMVPDDTAVEISGNGYPVTNYQSLIPRSVEAAILKKLDISNSNFDLCTGVVS